MGLQRALVLVFNGGPSSRAGELVLPVRLPQGAGRWPYLVHYLDRPERWHRVDLVRRRDASAIGGWAYDAHLMILGDGYRRTRGRHAAAAARFQEARTHRARRTAAAIVAVHGPRQTIEEGNVSAWFRRWGRSCLAFTPAG